MKKWRRSKQLCGQCAAMTKKGERCKVAALRGEGVCALHLPVDDQRRIAAVADNTKRLRAYWTRRQAEKTANAA